MAFQSTLPARGATRRRNTPRFCQSDFNPRSPHGERPGANAHQERDLIFQSTLPARGATMPEAFSVIWEEVISIHAPRTGSDAEGAAAPPVGIISIHAPRTGSDRYRPSRPAASATFQSTLPARGATCQGVVCTAQQAHFNPRSPHGERQPDGVTVYKTREFQSTLPARGATSRAHARNRRTPYFNPRSPHGERRERTKGVIQELRFQSTLPARGATTRHTQAQSSEEFQSTLPARGATVMFLHG